MATIAELLGKPKVAQVATTARPDRRVEAMHYVAAGLKGSPYRRDSQGRLRRNGRYASPPATVDVLLTPEQRLLCAIFGQRPSSMVRR